jgi:hypothetical protein
LGFEALGTSGSLSLNTRFAGYNRVIERFSPTGMAECPLLEKAYIAGRGIGEPCGCLSAGDLAEQGAVDSSGLAALGAAGQWFALHCKNFTRFDLNCHVSARKDDEGVVLFSASAEYSLENLNAPDEILEPLYFTMDSDLEAILSGIAGDIGKTMKARLRQPPAYHWCSWYYCYNNFDQKQLEEYLEGMISTGMINELRYVQIDAGYFHSAGDWLINNPLWPQGLRGAFEAIRKAGCRPGIWIAPFMIGNRSRLFKDHPDWALRKTDGSLLCRWEWYNEPKVCGYQDEEYYVLDTSHPEAMAYLRNVFRTFKVWGAELFKTDFMLWGYIDSVKVKRYAPGKTSIEYFRDFLKVVREEIGEESYWLACIAPFIPFVGYADGMRIGGDVGYKWEGMFSPQNMIHSLWGENFTNHLFYQNDPDALLLRDFFIKLTDTEVESLALLAAVSGGCLYTSDPVHKLREDRLALLRFIKPDDIRRRPSQPYLDEKRGDIVFVHRSKNRGIVFIFNKTDGPLTSVYNLGELGFDGPMKWYDYRKNGDAGIETGSLTVTTPAHGCNLFFLRRGDGTPDYNSLWKNL